jgi:hypothetical protein
MKSFLDGVYAEIRLQLRSYWTLALVGLFVILSISSIWNSYSIAKNAEPLINEFQTYMGSDFDKWLAESPDAQMLRDDINAAHPSNAASTVLTVCGSLGIIIFSIWSASVVGNEFLRRTASVKAAHSGWWRIIRGKLVVIGIIAVAITIIALVFGFIANQISWHFLKNSCPWVEIPIMETSTNVVTAVAAVVLGFGVYGVVAAAVTLLTKSFPVGVIVGVAVPYLERALNQWWLPQGAFSNILTNTFFYSDGSAASLPATSNFVSTPYSWLIMVGWLASAVVAYRFIALHQEIY